MSLKTKLEKSLNEKDVENIYRSELDKIEESSITSPYVVDGLLETKNIRSLLEFKYEEKLKNKLSQCNVLIQCLYYLKKFENAGDKLPSTIFVGDINECFAIHTNSIVKYLSSKIDWKIAPSEAHKRNPELIKAMVGDENILPFVYDVDDSFSIKTVIDKIKDFSDNVIRKVRITKHNIVTIFDYFDKNVLNKVDLTTNEKSNLFIQIVINPNENCLHPKRKNVLMTKSFGELSVNQNLFNSFFSHFEGDLYSPKEKEQLTALIDRLVEDSVRRNKGEFFTPTPFVDLAHKYISETFGEDWKEKFVVWDNSAGTLNLTRDYKFNELYCSTLEQSDIDTANQMGYNMEATKFQFDFLNDSDDKLPQGLQDAIESGKEILFLINPPYATANNMGTKEGSHKGGVSDTEVCKLMKKDNWGASSQNLYAQFLYKISKYQEKNKNAKIGIFCPPLFLSGGSYKKFRENFFKEFGYKKGFLFEACHFSDVAKNWGISFTIFGNELNNNKFNLDVVDFNDSFELEVKDTKEIYNTDNENKLSEFTRLGLKGLKTFDAPQMSSSTNVKQDGRGTVIEKSIYLGTFHTAGNAPYKNTTDVGLYTSCNSNSHSILKINFFNSLTGFVARKSISPNWINCKEEYLAPNESHPLYEQFTYDSIVYSLFNNSSQQSSLRQVDYKEKKWDIKNEFFWISKDEIQQLANDNSYDELYKDARTSDERFVYKKLFEEGIYDKLSPDAKEVLDMATDLVKKSFEMRELVSENHREYHLDSWDAGYAQLKLVWKEYFKDEFKTFRDKYKQLEDRMRPLVYELGFLKK
jgi:hypothetical protein